ncbi:hypothetical protein O181_002665 [Austropuccinia psidii MF-1]|uniref:Integrase zinc-binding domain-containing protein n=1 Tax=Austropuccinia psidii MF-1 TaxID=1389203 RepID=A0A9Q3BCW6_9BASI|nr:hypothetical protein [Austropuccinia psidii MF-1]
MNWNGDGLSIWSLENTPEKPAWITLEDNHIEGICVIEICIDFFKKAKESYKMYENCHILSQLLMKNCKDPSSSSKLDELWKKACDEKSFHLLHGILYHSAKPTCVTTLPDIASKKTLLHELHERNVYGHISEHRTLERVKVCSWSQKKRKDVLEYFQACDRFHNKNRDTEKKFGMMIQILEPKFPWEIINTDCVTVLPPAGDRSFNECLVLVDRYRKTPMFLSFHKDGTAMDTAIMI